MGVAGVVAALVVVPLLVVLVPVRAERARRRRAAALADRLGLDYLPGPVRLSDAPFGVLGRRPRGAHVFRNPSDPAGASVFRTTVIHPRRRRPEARTCGLFGTGLAAPHLVLRSRQSPQAARRLRRLPTVELESPRFGDLWEVRCADDRFATALLDPVLLDWLTENGGRLEIELVGDRGLAVTPAVDVESMPDVLDVVHRFVERIPPVARDLYPAVP